MSQNYILWSTEEEEEEEAAAFEAAGTEVGDDAIGE